MKIFIALALLFITEANAAGGPVFGRCSDSPVIKDFDPTRVKILTIISPKLLIH